MALVAVPSIFCFLALVNFLFWCRSNVEDIVAQSYCNAIQLLAFYPTLLISAIPAIRDLPTVKMVVNLVLLLIPVNQISFGLSAVYSVATVGAYNSALVNAPPLTPADYFVFTYTIPGVDGASPGPLLCIAYSVLTAPLWFYLLWRTDVKRYYYSPRMHDVRIVSGRAAEDADVAAERARVEGGGADGALVRIRHLRKEFKSPKKGGKPQPNKVAVDDLSLAVDGSGCFALLGPNGAGKTTTLSMLTGDIRATAGEAWVDGFSVSTQIPTSYLLHGTSP